MNAAVYWTLLFRVSTQQKAEKEIARAQALLGRALRVDKCERYWKDETRWRCEAVTALESSSALEQIAECLVLANRLARGWRIVGPDIEVDGRVGNFWGDFDVRHDHTSLSSLTWVNFTLAAGPQA